MTQYFKEFGNIICYSEKRKNCEKWDRRTIAINTFTLYLGESKGKSVDDRNYSMSVTNHAAGLGTCTQSGMTIQSYLSWETRLGKFADHTEFHSWDCEFPNRSLLEEIEVAESLADLVTPQSLKGKDFLDCEELDLMMSGRIEEVARGMGSPRRASNRRRRTSEGPELAYVRGGTRGGGEKGELTFCRGTV